MGKRQPIVIHGMLHDITNYAALIEAQAKTEAFHGASKKEQPKVKTLGLMKPNYKRTTNK